MHAWSNGRRKTRSRALGLRMAGRGYAAVVYTYDDTRAGIDDRQHVQRDVQKRRATIALATIIGLIGVAVLIGSQLPDTTAPDAQISSWFADRRTPTWNTVTAFFSGAASTFVVIGIGLTVMAVNAVRRRRDGLMVLVVAMFGEVVIFLSITALVDRPRPDVAHLDPAPPTSSFPSGHTMATFVLWTAIAVVATVQAWPYLLRLLTRFLAVFMPLAVALSRVYRGMHHPTDVTASLLIGCIWTVVVISLFTPRATGQQCGQASSRGTALTPYAPTSRSTQS